MNKEQYEARRSEIYNQLAQLKDEYIRENTSIEPGSYVKVGGMKCYLKSYTVNSGDIYPVLYQLKGNGTPSAKQLYVSKNAKIEKA